MHIDYVMRESLVRVWFIKFKSGKQKLIDNNMVFRDFGNYTMIVGGQKLKEKSSRSFGRVNVYSSRYVKCTDDVSSVADETLAS